MRHGPTRIIAGLWRLWTLHYVEVVLSLIAVLALAGGVKVYQGTIDTVFVALLLVALGAVVGARYLGDLMGRITKIGPAGIELSGPWATPALNRLLEYSIVQSRNVRDPFGQEPLTAEERWVYEQLSVVG